MQRIKRLKEDYHRSEKPKPYTILLLTKDNFIFTDGKTVFYEERIRDHADQDSRR